MAGLAPSNANIRQPAPDVIQIPDEDIVVELGGDAPAVIGDKSITIEHADGSVTVSLNGRPEPTKPTGHFDNLVDAMDDAEVSRISEDLLRGIDDDLNSRKDWTETYAQGIRLLGLMIEVPNISGASDGAPVEGMSKVRHPLLLEAVLRFQANARSELLPTDGPVKVRNDDNNAVLGEDQLADDLEEDLNHYLTVGAPEYYPDTDRMLLKLGFGGTSFKKVYFCPLRNRPVSETVDADDLIVNSAATDLHNAKRVTHKVMMRPSTVKRLQIMGVYRDVSLMTPLAPKNDAVQREQKAQQGIQADSAKPEDRDREIYECYCELDIQGYEHEWKGKISGLEIPYRVTIDVSSREVLSITRNFNQETEQLPVARTNFVKYTFVPGLGFYDIGLLHILGNTTNALTAAWREMLDAGMYANFPGFLMADSGARQNTNIFRIPPGGGALVKTGGVPLKDAVMPLPYTTQGMAALGALAGEIAQTGARIGGTSEQQVGEGRADAPVGTTLALIDQATKVMNSVHKRCHASQAEEFTLLKECFREHPESFWQRKGRSARVWDEATFMRALDNCDLVPQADPNTASHGQRVMKIMGLKQLQAADPAMFNGYAINVAALAALGWSNPEQFMRPEDQAEQPSPEIMKGMADVQNDTKKADADMLRAQSAAQKVKQEGLAAANDQAGQQDTPVDVLEAQTRAKEVGDKKEESQLLANTAAEDRASDEKIAAVDLAKAIIEKTGEIKVAEAEMKKVGGDVAKKPNGGK
jgi:hypothetical protein